MKRRKCTKIFWFWYLPTKNDVIEHFKEKTVKGSQFKKSILEFSGACGGCDETPYSKLITQLFVDRLYIANVTECSSIWGNSSKLLHILKIYLVESSMEQFVIWR